jgi:hypothetical protein
MVIIYRDAPPNSWIDSTANPKVKTMEGQRIGARSLARNTSGVEGRARAPRWGLRWVTSRSIIHMDLHKPNNMLNGAYLEHFWCTDEPRANMDSQDSPRLELGGSHHLPPYTTLCAWPRGQHPNIILSHDSQIGVLKFPKLGFPRNFGGP